jgi:hypothetical protein
MIKQHGLRRRTTDAGSGMPVYPPLPRSTARIPHFLGIIDPVTPITAQSGEMGIRTQLRQASDTKEDRRWYGGEDS